MKTIVLFLALVAALPAQLSRITWTTMSATGTTAAFNVPGSDVHTIAAIVTGSPSSCTMHLEGSLDGTNYFDISGDQTCTSNVMFHVTARAVALVRANVTLFSGGTSPTISITYLGHSTGGRQ